MLERYEGLSAGEESDDSLRLAGRLMARRGHGKAAFLDLEDRSGKLQLHARQDVLGEQPFERLVALDLGDLVGVEGAPVRTKRGELSLRVDRWTLLTKSLRPPPDKYHGLADVETRYRQRELDLIANPEARELFVLRTRVVACGSQLPRPARVPRGRDARAATALRRCARRGHSPLTTTRSTHLYLRIATELYLKRLIVGGLEKVYEMGKDFRNEGLSHKHNPEFTMLESYEAYADYLDVAAMTEQLVAHVAQQVLGRTTVETDGATVDLSPPWRRVTLRDAILERTRRRHRPPRRARVAGGGDGGRRRWSHREERAGWGKLVDELLSKHVEPTSPSPPSCSTTPLSCRRSRGRTAASRGWWSASRGSSAASR